MNVDRAEGVHVDTLAHEDSRFTKLFRLASPSTEYGAKSLIH